jgi:hypothetical protein
VVQSQPRQKVCKTISQKIPPPKRAGSSSKNAWLSSVTPWVQTPVPPKEQKKDIDRSKDKTSEVTWIYKSTWKEDKMVNNEVTNPLNILFSFLFSAFNRCKIIESNNYNNVFLNLLHT